MAAKTDSDIESDEEFERVLAGVRRSSSRLSSFYSDLHNQFSKKRLDRVDKLFSILPCLLDDLPSNFYPRTIEGWIDFFTKAAFQYMPPEGCSDSLRLILRHVGEKISKRQVESVVLLAVFYRDADSLQLLRETFGDVFVEEAIEDLQSDSVFSSRLLWASEHDDLADYQGFLTPVLDGGKSSCDCDRPDEHTWRHGSPCMELIEKIAELGRADLVDALLTELQRKVKNTLMETEDMNFAREIVLRAACRKGNFALASSMLSCMCINWDQRSPPLVCTTLLHDNTLCTAEFLESLLLWTRKSITKSGRKINPEWLTDICLKVIDLHARCHLEILLDEIEQIGTLFEDFGWFPLEVFNSKSTALLRVFLLRYPKALIQDWRFNPAEVLREHQWPAGARLLVEAGATTKGEVPPEHAELFQLSLEDRCRIVARRNIKCPLVQNVHQLPLPVQVKRRFLYRYR